MSTVLKPRRAQPRSAPPRRRIMARPSPEARHPRPPRRPASPAGRGPRPLILALVLLGLAALAGWWVMPAFSTPPEAKPTVPAAYSGALAGGQPTGAVTRPGQPLAATVRPGPAATPPPQHPPAGRSPSAHSPGMARLPAPAPTPESIRPPGAAPASAAEFDQRAQVIQIGFPVRQSTAYRYRDNWADLRVGSAEHYNHAHSRHRGELRRAHDGIDIYARRGEPVLAPFAGLVIDPSQRYEPWHSERYGLTVVIVSEEPLSEGYAALLSHLGRLWVEPGQQVRRGEVLGTVGSTGNAEGGRPHLHFELRAPFVLTWRQAGDERLVDAFNPYPSLVAADPQRSD